MTGTTNDVLDREFLARWKASAEALARETGLQAVEVTGVREGHTSSRRESDPRSWIFPIWHQGRPVASIRAVAPAGEETEPQRAPVAYRRLLHFREQVESALASDSSGRADA